jgi:hypothetical protein
MNPNQDQVQIRPGRLTEEDRAADIWANQLVNDRLPRLRALSEKWSGTIATLAALLGAATVLDADSAVRGLEELWSILYAACVAAALGFAAWATLSAASAAQGGIVEIPPDVGGRKQLQEKLVQSAINDLKWSRIATLVALALLAAAFAIRWFAPVET